MGKIILLTAGQRNAIQRATILAAPQMDGAKGKVNIVDVTCASITAGSSKVTADKRWKWENCDSQSYLSL